MNIKIAECTVDVYFDILKTLNTVVWESAFIVSVYNCSL